MFFKGEAKAELDGFTKLMDHVTRAGQYAENPPTGQRAIPWIIGALGGNVAMSHPAGVASVWGSAKIAQAMLATDAGKRFLLAASKVEPGSSAMNRIVNEISAKMPAIAGRLTGSAISPRDASDRIDQLRGEIQDFSRPGVKNPSTGSAATKAAEIHPCRCSRSFRGRSDGMDNGIAE